MKFGKVLQQAMQMSSRAWEAYWVDYKVLKRIIKDCAQIKKEEKLDGRKTKIKPNAKEDNDSIRTSLDEMNFFRTLRSEIKKIADFFIKEQAAYVGRVQVLEAQFQAVRANPQAEAKTALMTSCVALYKELLLLENLAVMNFCGISKILKKHDKWTGYATRNKFMRTILMKQPFATYLPLLQMIDRLEHIFMEATGGCSIDQHDSQHRLSGSTTQSGAVASPQAMFAAAAGAGITAGARAEAGARPRAGTGTSAGPGASRSSSPERQDIGKAIVATTASSKEGRAGSGSSASTTTTPTTNTNGAVAPLPRPGESVSLVRVNALRHDARHFRQTEDCYDGDEDGDGDSVDDDSISLPSNSPEPEETVNDASRATAVPSSSTSVHQGRAHAYVARKEYNSDSDAAAVAMLSMKESTSLLRSSDSETGSSRFKRKACSPLTTAMRSNGKRKMSFATILN